MADTFGFWRGLAEGVSEGLGRSVVEMVSSKKPDPAASGNTNPKKGPDKNKPAPAPSGSTARTIGMIAGTQLKQLEQAEKRRKLYYLLIEMSWEEKRNIIGLLKNKFQTCEENDVVIQLGEITCEVGKDHKKALIHLNKHLPETDVTEAEEGVILLELLNDNGKQQLAKRGVYEAKKAGRMIRDEVLPEAKRVAKKLGPAGDSAAETLSGLTSWLRKHGGK
jgi:hypothetical protein